MNNNKQAHYNHPSTSLTQSTCRLLLRWLGWNIAPFPDVKKAVAIGGPHTSNWDGIIGLMGASAIGIPATIMIKDSLFFWPMGALLRRFGAIPINRGQAGSVVEQAVEQFRQRDKLVLVVTPEGTRSNAAAWKTGFYRIAKEAKVPVVVATADYVKKEVTYPAVFMPTDNQEADFAQFHTWFASVTPRHPERLSAPVKERYLARINQKTPD
ncbi:1-acyl-sn-glycerol-3-phosphate acyltransferase [Salinispirillum marinum]|uniref:1-acyl-sn-glycerol-3-phosphate acyltransferase n=2 Tax=Saccharospirillaceae TaxID=255527 RepID=A0ABV8BG53_9GAMM